MNPSSSLSICVLLLFLQVSFNAIEELVDCNKHHARLSMVMTITTDIILKGNQVQELSCCQKTRRRGMSLVVAELTTHIMQMEIRAEVPPQMLGLISR